MRTKTISANGHAQVVLTPTPDPAGDAFLHERAAWYRAERRDMAVSTAVSVCWLIAGIVWTVAGGLLVGIGLITMIGGGI